MNAPWTAEAVMEGVVRPVMAVRPLSIAERALAAARDVAARNPRMAQTAGIVAGFGVCGLAVYRLASVALPHLGGAYWHARDYVGSLLQGAPAPDAVAQRVAVATAEPDPVAPMD